MKRCRNNGKRWHVLAAGIVLSLLILIISGTALADVSIDQTHFPDSNFMEFVKKYDTDGNGKLSDEEIAAVEYIYTSYQGISNFQGIEYFTSMTELTVVEPTLYTIDLSKNPGLTTFNCGYSSLYMLDLSKNPGLLYVNCGSNSNLIQLDVSKNTALMSLECYYCSLSKLDVSNNTALRSLSCGNNQLKELDVSKNTALYTLMCNNNPLEKLDLSQNTRLASLWCFDTQLTELDLSHNPALKELQCFFNNGLKKIDISPCAALVDLVKTTQPDENGTTWVKDSNGDGLEDARIEIDKTTELITSGSGDPTPAPSSDPVDLSNCEITSVADQIYTGKKLQPEVNVTCNGNTLKIDTDYRLSYKNNKNVGKATITISGKGAYTGQQTVTFLIQPKAIKLSEIKAGSKKLTVKWKKGSGIDGYEIQYSMKKDFSNAKKVTISKASATSTTIEKLKSKKTYYVRIRTFKNAGGVTYTSAWSEVKSKKTK